METDLDSREQQSAPTEPERPVVLQKAPRPVPPEAPDGEEDPRFLPGYLDPTAPTVYGPLPEIEMSRGWRRWLLRAFVVLLLAGGVAVAVVAATIVRDETEEQATGRRPVNGVLMPDDAHFREVANTLLARKRPEKVSGMTVEGSDGKVTVIRYRPGRTSFMSNYINPNAIQVIARAVGLRSYEPITIDKLRLEVLRRTGRQRWRLAGTQSGRPWRATINPNGTNFRLIRTK